MSVSMLVFIVAAAGVQLHKGFFERSLKDFFLAVRSSEQTTLFMSSLVLQEAHFTQYDMKKEVSTFCQPALIFLTSTWCKSHAVPDVMDCHKQVEE